MFSCDRGHTCAFGQSLRTFRDAHCFELVRSSVLTIIVRLTLLDELMVVVGTALCRPGKDFGGQLLECNFEV